MKLNLFFIVMDVLTLLAYPILLVYNLLGVVFKPKKRPVLAD